MSRKFNLGLDVVMERKDCKNFRVTKNYAYSCSEDIDEAIKNARCKGGMKKEEGKGKARGFDRKKVNALIYILNYGSKLASPTCVWI